MMGPPQSSMFSGLDGGRASRWSGDQYGRSRTQSLNYHSSGGGSLYVPNSNNQQSSMLVSPTLFDVRFELNSSLKDFITQRG